MGVFSAINSSSSGMTAQRVWMDTISQNIANVNTTRTENGEPYRRKMVVFSESDSNTFSQYLTSASKKIIDGNQGGGVRVAKIVEDSSDFTIVHDPSHPDADEEGNVKMPNVNILEEMVNMISATRSYEANVTSMNAAKGMAMKALEIGNR